MKNNCLKLNGQIELATYVRAHMRENHTHGTQKD